MSVLTSKAVYETMQQFFPAKNDDHECDYEEELQELNDFGITSSEQLLDLLRKRRNEVLEIDQSPMNEMETRMHSAADGEAVVANRIQKGFWFSYPALLRIALELEFSKAYETYALKRDGIAE